MRWAIRLYVRAMENMKFGIQELGKFTGPATSYAVAIALVNQYLPAPLNPRMVVFGFFLSISLFWVFGWLIYNLGFIEEAYRYRNKQNPYLLEVWQWVQEQKRGKNDK